MKKSTLITALSLFCLSANALNVQTGSDVRSWLLSQQAKPSVLSEMNKYFFKNDVGSNNSLYVKNFINILHTSMVTEAEKSLQIMLNQNDCSDSVQVLFPNKLTQGNMSKVQIAFEKEIIKSQSYSCLGRLNIDKVFNTLTSEAFQRKTIDGLKSVSTNMQTNRVCQNISIFPLGESNACYTQNVMRTENQYIIQSFNEENINFPTAQIYHRETITIITQLPSGEISLYVLNYGRGPDLPFHSVVEKMIKNQQNKLIKNLILMSR